MMKKKTIETKMALSQRAAFGMGCLGYSRRSYHRPERAADCTNLLEFGMDMQQAIDAPKITFIELDMIAKGIPEETL